MCFVGVAFVVGLCTLIWWFRVDLFGFALILVGRVCLGGFILFVFRCALSCWVFMVSLCRDLLM